MYARKAPVRVAVHHLATQGLNLAALLYRRGRTGDFLFGGAGSGSRGGRMSGIGCWLLLLFGDHLVEPSDLRLKLVRLHRRST